MGNNNSTHSLRTHLIVILFFGLLCGFLGIAAGKEMDWDFLSYHYYAAYALLHHRANFDYFPPASIQYYFNPTIDLLAYFLINYLPQRLAAFTLGSIHGLNFWLLSIIIYVVYFDKPNLNSSDPFMSLQAQHVARMKRSLFHPGKLSLIPAETKNVSSGLHFLWSIALTVFCLGGAVSLAEVGSFKGDDLLSIFVLSAVLLQIQGVRNIHRIVPYMIASGLMLGLGTGLKMTASIYFIGFNLAIWILTLPIKTKLKLFIIWNIAFAVGFFITAGHWMLFNWHHYQNPFYPMFNGYFHAAGFPNTNWHDQRVYLHGWYDQLTGPIHFGLYGSAEWPVFDARLIFLYVLLIASILVALQQLIRGNLKLLDCFSKENQVTRWLLVFYITSYIAWQQMLSVARYFVTIELLTPLIIVILNRYIIVNTTKREFNVYLLFVLCCSFWIFGYELNYPISILLPSFILIYWLMRKSLKHVEQLQFATRATCILSIAFITILITIKPHYPLRVPFLGNNYLNVELPKNVDYTQKAIVLVNVPNFLPDANLNSLLPDAKEISLEYTQRFNLPPHAALAGYLIPFFPADWRFIGLVTVTRIIHKNIVVKLPQIYPKKAQSVLIPFTLGIYNQSLTSKANTLLEENAGPIYIITTESNKLSTFDFASKIGLKKSYTNASECQKIKTQLSGPPYETLLLCEFEKRIFS